MKPTTTAAIERLECTEWFASIGREDIPGVVFARSWLDAAANFSSPKWEDVQLDAFNTLSQKALLKAQARYNEWNNHVVALKPVLDDLIQRKAGNLVQKENLPVEFIGNVYADLLGVGMEAEYSDLVPPGFYTNVILNCYLKGHFPCGWEGDFPQGRLIVY